MIRSGFLLVLAVGVLVAVAPAGAQAKSCGAAKGVGGGTTVTNVTTSSGSCAAAKSAARAFARSNGIRTSGYGCIYRTASDDGPRRSSYRVTCTRDDRKLTFKVRYAGIVLLPALPALPQANAGA
ncbi:MAG: hypothetical protein MUC84_12740 [Solirubrobacteraceae bacterium]|nr:hypothetical protein [Solirubrobacteraceae bacterium]